MPDSYGPDFLSRSMFFREAEAGPTQQELATMTAPFGGNPQQAMGFMQSPGMQQQLNHFGMHFNPSQIRQSPFFPNSFLQGHPNLRGMLGGAMANVGATPEAPLVSGAGSGMSRAIQGMAGGPEMQRQYQVRQMMAPMQAMGMQLPMMAEQRRQELLKSLENDMNQRRIAEGQKSNAEKIKDDVYAPAGAPGYWQMEKPGTMGSMPMPGGPGAMQMPQQQSGPIGMPGVPGGFPAQHPMATPGGAQYHPYDPNQVGALSAAKDPQKQAQAGYLGTKTQEQTQETNLGMPGARVDAEKGLANQRNAAADKSRAGAEHLKWQSTPEGRVATQLAKSDHWFNQAIAKIDAQYNPLIAQAEQEGHKGMVKSLEQKRQAEIAAQTEGYLTQVVHSGGQLTPEQQQFLQSRSRQPGVINPAAGGPQANPAPNPPMGPASQVPGAAGGGQSATTAPSSSWDQIKKQRQSTQHPPIQSPPPLPHQPTQPIPKATVGGPAMAPQAAPQAQPTPAPVPIPGENELFSILDRSPLHDDQKTALYKAYTSPKNEDEFIKTMDGLGNTVTDDIRSTLYQMRFPQPKGMQQPRGLQGPQGPTTIGPQPHGIENWFQNLQGDILQGGQATLPGRILHGLGAEGLEGGAQQGAGRFMGGPMIGPADIAHGGMQMFDPGQRVAGAREALQGGLEVMGRPTAMLSPEALPALAGFTAGGELGTRGLEYMGVKPETADLVTQLAMLAGLSKTGRRAVGGLGGKTLEFAKGGPGETGLVPGPRDAGQPAAMQAGAPPVSRAAEAINRMHKQAFGQEGGPRPVTEAGETGAREVSPGVGRGESAVPLQQPAAGRGGVGTERRVGPQVQLPKEVERRQIQQRVAAEDAALAAKQTSAYDDMRARERAPGGRLAPEEIAAEKEARRAEESKLQKAAQPTYRPNMRTEPASLGDLAQRQRAEGRITDQTKDRLVGEQARLKAGLKPEEAPARFAETIGEQGQKGFRWSALSPEEQQKFMEVADREKAKSTAATPAPKAPEAPTAPGGTGKPVPPTEPVREPAVAKEPTEGYQTPKVGEKAPPPEPPAGRKPTKADLTPDVRDRAIEIAKQRGSTTTLAAATREALREKGFDIPEVKGQTSNLFDGMSDAEVKRMASPQGGEKPATQGFAKKELAAREGKPVGTDLDKLKQRVLRVGGDQKAIDAIIKVADSKGGTAKERTERAMEGLRNYGSQMWKESRAKGKAPKDDPKQKGFFSFRGRPTTRGAYRSSMEKLDSVVDSTSNMDIDKAVVAARDKVRESMGVRDKLSSTFLEMRAMGKAFAHWYMHPEEGKKLSESGAIPEAIGGPPSGPSRGFKESLGSYSEARQQSKYATGEFIKHIKREVTPMGRHGITNYLQAGGDLDLLRERASKTTDPKLKKGYEVAQNLSDKEKRVAGAIKEYFDDRLKEAMDLGVLDHGLERYVTQIWDKDSGFRRGVLADINAGKFNKNFRYAKQRFYESYFEGEQAGKTPANKDIGFLVSSYENSLNEAIAARKFVKDIFSKVATDGRPLIVPEGKLARPIKDPSDAVKGRAIAMRGPARGKLMSRELAEAIGVPLNEKSLSEADKARTDTSDYVRIDHPAFRTWQFSTEGPDGQPIFAEADSRVHPDIAKRLENIYTNSWFQQSFMRRAVLRGQSFLKQTLLGVPGFHYVQEGFHATAHGVNPFSKDIISGSALRSAMADPAVQDGMRKGLMLYDHNASAKFGEGIRGVFGLIPGLGKEITIGNKAIGGWMEGLQEHLFQTYIPGLKAEMFKKALGRNLRRYSGDIQAGRVTKAQLTEVTAAQANAAFGELNYDWMGRNKTAQDIFRLAALAPDFLEARLRFAGQALRPYGREQQMALFVRLGAIQYAAARVLNMVTNDGDPIFDPEYMFQWKVGDRVYGLRSMMSDLQHLYKDPSGFAFYRMSPLLRQGVAQPAAQYFGGRKMTLGDVIKENAPIPLQGLLQDYISKGVKDKEAANSFMQSLGIQTRKYRSPSERERLEKLEDKRQRMLRGEKTGLAKPRAPRLY